MNKLVKNKIISLFIGSFGFLLVILFWLLNIKMLSIIVFAIVVLLLLCEAIYTSIYVSKYKRNYYEKHTSSTEEDNEETKSDSVNKIKIYKTNKKVYNICYIISAFFMIADVLLAYLLFEDIIFSNDDSLKYCFIVLVIVLYIIAIINSLRELKAISTIDNDLENLNFEIINSMPLHIKPLYLYYGNNNSRNIFKIGYGLEMTFENNLKLIALIDFPYIGMKNMMELIEKDLLGKNYKLKYLKNSKIIITLDSKIKKVFQ